MKYLSLKKNIARLPIVDAYEKTNNFKGKKWLYVCFTWAFEHMKKRGFLISHFRDDVTHVYNYTEHHDKLLSDRVIRLINDYEKDFYSVDPGKYVIVMGERYFFETVQETRYDNDIFFYRPTTFHTKARYQTDYRSFMNWDVHVVPLFDGVAILPKAIIESRR